MVLDHDAVRQRQAKARPHAHRLGCEERFEYPVLDFKGNAMTVVGDLDEHAAVFPPAANGDFAVGTHGMACIDEQVQENLIDL